VGAVGAAKEVNGRRPRIVDIDTHDLLEAHREAGGAVNIFAGLTEEQIEATLRRMAAYARGLLRKRIWRGERGGPAPGGVNHEDLVYEVVLQLMDGVRRYDPNLDLAENLRRGIASRVSALCTRAENSVLRLVAVDGNGYQIASEGGSNPEYNELVDRIHEALLERAMNDEQLMSVMALFERTGEFTPTAIMEELSIDEKAARALGRRFSRILDAAVAYVQEHTNDKSA
jgi:hypothetical protein